MRKSRKIARFFRARRLILAAVAGCAAGQFNTADVHAAGVPVWGVGEAGVFDHEAGNLAFAGSVTHVALPISATTPSLLQDPITFPFGEGNSNASAGLQHSESSTTAKIIVASGTGISQTQFNDFESPSTLDVSFTAEWTIPAAGFGAPIAGTFSLPIGTKVGAHGSASASAQITWDYIDGTSEIPLGAFSKSQTWNNLNGNSAMNVLTSFTSPAMNFNPNQLTGGEILVINADITFTALSDDPTLIEIPTAADFSDMGVTTDQVGTFDVDVVPEPTSLAMIATGASTLLMRRRKRI